MNKYPLVFGIVTIFILLTLVPISFGYPINISDTMEQSSMPISDKTVIIVDDEGDGDYTSIKEALSHADPGDTIEVYSGTYYEHGIIISDNNITLKGIPYELGNGSDTGKPFINGQGKDFVIAYNMTVGVVITNFHIENSGGTQHDIIHIYRSDKCEFSNNDVFKTTFALIYCRGSTNIQIKNNNIGHNNHRHGIFFVDGSNYNTISDNIISDIPQDGILFWDSNHNTVTGNKISRCREFGIDLASSDYNTIKGNSFEDNTVGVQNYLSLGCRIKNNNFIDNQIQAQFVYGFPRFIGLTNRWRGNYWNGSRTRPYPIMGGPFFLIPFVQFDWFPAKEPYDIGVSK